MGCAPFASLLFVEQLGSQLRPGVLVVQDRLFDALLLLLQLCRQPASGSKHGLSKHAQGGSERGARGLLAGWLAATHLCERSSSCWSS